MDLKFVNMMDLLKFKKLVIQSIVKGHDGSSLHESSWSGFAVIVLEGGAIRYSASLKLALTGDPSQVKPVYQRQVVSGFHFRSVQGVSALFGESEIDRTQLEFTVISESYLSDKLRNLVA